MKRPPWLRDAAFEARLPPFDLRRAKEMQELMRSRVVLHDDLARLRRIAGIDIGFEDGGATTVAAVVVLSYPDLSLVETQVARLPTSVPYIPGYLSFRELPAARAAFSKLTQEVQLALVDGMGIAHPRRLGVASHLGLELGVPTIGVGKSKLIGVHAELPPEQGAEVPLLDRDERIGAVLRSKARCLPLYISSGHRVSLETAVGIVRSCLRGYRLPEPTRLADRLASRRGSMPAKKAEAPAPFSGSNTPA